MRALLVLALVLSSAAPLSAKDGGDEKPEEKKICRSEKVTGSLTKVRRICMTQDEWDKLAAATAKSHSDKVRGAAGGTNSAFSNCNAPGAC